MDVSINSFKTVIRDPGVKQGAAESENERFTQGAARPGRVPGSCRPHGARAGRTRVLLLSCGASPRPVKLSLAQQQSPTPRQLCLWPAPPACPPPADTMLSAFERGWEGDTR